MKNLPDVVIPLGTGSRWQDNELRFCLRSIEKNLSGVNEVVIVGEKPKWLTNVRHIPCKDVPGKKEFSIFTKINAAISEGVSDPFIFTNDDIFFIKPIAPANFKFWYDSTIQVWHDKARGRYKKSIENTMNLNGYNEHYTDIHTPIIYFHERIKRLPFVWPCEYVIKTLYTSTNFFWEYEFEEMKDCKINAPRNYNEIMALIKDRMFFSVGEYGISIDMKKVLNDLFTKKSKFEF